MELILETITHAVRNVIRTFFASDLDVMSDEVRQILSNPDDAKKYRQAIDDIRTGKEKEVTIQLSNKRSLTLVQ